jgi:hypothetical protein
MLQVGCMARDKEIRIPVISSWWFVWMIFMGLCLVPSIRHRRAYREWGPPMPIYVQRRRGHLIIADKGSAASTYSEWRWRGDFVWLSLFIGVLWAGSALWWGW